MSARRSKQSTMIKRYGKMADGYQKKIDRQGHIIEKLMAANAVLSDLAYGVEHEAKDVKQARKWAKEASAKVEAILSVPNDPDDYQGDN